MMSQNIIAPMLRKWPPYRCSLCAIVLFACPCELACCESAYVMLLITSGAYHCAFLRQPLCKQHQE